jgi:hypothetical protein
MRFSTGSRRKTNTHREREHEFLIRVDHHTFETDNTKYRVFWLVGTHVKYRQKHIKNKKTIELATYFL